MGLLPEIFSRPIKGKNGRTVGDAVLKAPAVQQTDYERRNAPAGFEYGEKKYRRGQFIPGSVMFQHAPPKGNDGTVRMKPAEVQYDDASPIEDEIKPLWAKATASGWGASNRKFVAALYPWGVSDATGNVHHVWHVDGLYPHDPAEHGDFESLPDSESLNGQKLNARHLWAFGLPGGEPPPAPEQDWRPNEAMPEDYYSRTSYADQIDDAQEDDASSMSDPDDPVNRHLDVLTSGVDKPDYRDAAREYLNEIPPHEQQALFGAIGIHPADTDPHGAVINAVLAAHAAQPPSAPGLTSAVNQIGPLLNPVPAPPPPAPVSNSPTNQYTWQPSTREHASLAFDPVRADTHLGGGANETRLLTLHDGSQGVFKPFKGELPLRGGIDPGTYWRREVAASEVARLIGYDDLVPSTSFRAHGNEEGSIQRFISGGDLALHVSDSVRYGDHSDAARAAVFDYIIGNTDRHTGNWLVKDWKPVLIDNGLSFPHMVKFSDPNDHDFVNTDYWTHAVQHQLPIPDMTGMREKWPEIEEQLDAAGIEPEAIELARQRFDDVTSGQYQAIGELPAFWTRDGKQLRDAVY